MTTRRSSAFRALAVGVIALLAGVLLAACGSSDDNQGAAPTTTTTTTTAAPSSTTAPSTTTAPTTTSTTTGATTTAPAQTRLSVYFLDGDHLAAVHRSVPETRSVAAAAMAQLLAGPTSSEQQSGLTSAVPSGTRLLSVSIDKGVATVDLTSAYQAGGGSLSMTARAAQVVFTLTQFSSVQRVAFRLDGKPLSVLGGEGLVLSSYDERAEFEDLLPAVFAEAPALGDRVLSPIRVWGTANVFEAVFRIELIDHAGKRVVDKVVMASSGTGTRGTFDFTFRFAASPGAGRLVLSYDSPKDGSKVVVDEIPVTIA